MVRSGVPLARCSIAKRKRRRFRCPCRLMPVSRRKMRARWKGELKTARASPARVIFSGTLRASITQVATTRSRWARRVAPRTGRTSRFGCGEALATLSASNDTHISSTASGSASPCLRRNCRRRCRRKRSALELAAAGERNGRLGESAIEGSMAWRKSTSAFSSKLTVVQSSPPGTGCETR